MHLEGHGRNEIARLLNEQGLHVSEGSAGNIVRAYREYESSLKSNASTNDANSTPSGANDHQST